MNANPQVLLFIGGIIFVAAIAIVMWVMARKSRSAELREHFGSEYDRAVKTRGSRTAAEDELVARAQEAKQFEIRSLTAAERGEYQRQWKTIESHFVERPTTAVVEADELITTVMRTRGYPMADFEKHAALLSVEHPRVVDHYRKGHETIDAQARGAASTEDLRQAVLHYRALFEELVGGTADVVSEAPRTVVRTSEIREEDRPR